MSHGLERVTPRIEGGHEHSEACYGAIPETEGKGRYLRCGQVGSAETGIAEIVSPLRDHWLSNGKADQLVAALKTHLASRVAAARSEALEQAAEFVEATLMPLMSTGGIHMLVSSGELRRKVESLAPKPNYRKRVELERADDSASA
jgi:hypothetical protein